MQRRVRAVADELRLGALKPEPATAALRETRTLVESGWRVVRDLLATGEHRHVATDVDRFVARMPPPLTEREWFGEQLRQHRRPDSAHVLGVSR
jgi:hypothetical protein